MHTLNWRSMEKEYWKYICCQFNKNITAANLLFINKENKNAKL